MEMESLLVVGGDKLGDITKKLQNTGFKNIIHLNGRKIKRSRKEIPEKIDIILVLTDYINHNLSKVIKKEAQEKAIPIYFSKRSWSSISKELNIN
jgi:hypothetical protein